MNMQTAEVKIEQPQPISRRFEVPDLDRHGIWLVPRLLKAFPHLYQNTLIGWLRTIIYNNEFLFLFQDNGLALAQVLSASTLQPRPIVQERFVFVADPKNSEHLEAAAGFYDDFARWAKHHGADVVTVEAMTDVPHEMIAKRIGRLFEQRQYFARV